MSKRLTLPFRLSGKATAKLNKYLGQIRQGVINVCELHTHDACPSLEQSAFEELYIERILAQTVTALSVSLRSMTEGLMKQKEAEGRAALGKDANNPQGENKGGLS